MRNCKYLCLNIALLCFYKWESLETMFNNYLFDKHLMKACLAAVFAIGLAACSSSSDTSSTTPDPAPDPGPTQEEQQLAALQQEIADSAGTAGDFR